MPRPARLRRLAAFAAGPALLAGAAWGQDVPIPALAADGPVAPAADAGVRLLPILVDDAPAGAGAGVGAAAVVPAGAAGLAEAASPMIALRGGRAVPVSLQNLLVRSLDHSAQVRVFAELPEIRRTSITEADAAFDWHGFAESRWSDVSDPVGNTLTTGGADIFEDHHASGAAGFRRRNRAGGRLEAAQRFGWQDTNSTFFIPDQQGTARLSLSYTQPILRGAGQTYNEALTVLAAIDTGVATDEFHRQLQSHLLEVARAYWGLSLERNILVQKRASLTRAEDIARRLKLRAQIDAVASQIARADAAVAARRSDLFRAEAAVRNAEGRVRALVNDPALGSLGNDVELIPTDVPSEEVIPVSVAAAVEVALRERPEVSQALRQIRAACVRLDMSENELLPVLNLVTEGYVSGLRGGGSVGDAYVGQFDDGRPSYSVGLQFEVPLGNRAARARYARRSMELRQLRNQYRTTLETLSLEVEVAARELQTSGLELDAKRQALRAAEVQLDYVTQRWIHLPGEGGTASLVLESLLDGQDRLAEAEVGLLTSRITYNLAMMELKRATGELLSCERVQIGKAMVNCLPTTVLDKPELAVRPRFAASYGPADGLTGEAPPAPVPALDRPTPAVPAPFPPVRDAAPVPAAPGDPFAPGAAPAAPAPAGPPAGAAVESSVRSVGHTGAHEPRGGLLGRLFGRKSK